VRDAADGVDYAEVARYQQNTSILMRQVTNASEELKRTQDLLAHMKAAAVRAPQAPASLFTRLDTFGVELSQLETRLSGNKVRAGLDESTLPSIGGRAYNAANTWSTTQAPTATQKADFEIAKTGFVTFSAELEALLSTQLVQLETDLAAAGAPSWR
jgi:hypothetical protein